MTVTPPYFTTCITCKSVYYWDVTTCEKCGTDFGLYSEPYEIKEP